MHSAASIELPKLPYDIDGWNIQLAMHDVSGWMWRGHDLRHFRSEIAGMLATVDRTGTNIPNIPEGIRDPCCSQTRPPKWPRVQSANWTKCSTSMRLMGQMTSGNMTPASQPIKGWGEEVRARVYFHQTDRPVVLQPFLYFIWRKFILLSLVS